MIANPIQDLFSSDIGIDPDGSINLISDGGTEVFHPSSQHMDPDWLDAILGLQHRNRDPVSH